MSDRVAASGPGRLLDALAFAAHKHRDHRRKDAEASPYINHPIAVARVLASEAAIHDEALLLAAILHDTVEDTDTTPDEITAHFGAEVSGLVAEVTDDKTLHKAERKRLQVEHAAGATLRAQQLKIADKICNLRDIGACSPVAWTLARKVEYLDWSARVVDGCRGTHAQLERLFDAVLKEARERLAALHPP